MKRSTSIFVGLLLVFLSSWLALVLIPYIQLGRMLPDIDDTTRDETPAAFSGLAEQGRQIYAANGCVYCHSQQVGSRVDSADLDREGWGARRTVARDYLRDRAAYLGNSRLGPDLANVGLRHDKAGWYYEHFYDPDQLAPGTNCPPLRFLVDFHVIKGQPSTDAIPLRDAPVVPVVEEFSTIADPSLSNGNAFCTVNRVPFTLVLNVSSKCCSVIWPSGENSPTPALANKMSR